MMPLFCNRTVMNRESIMLTLLLSSSNDEISAKCMDAAMKSGTTKRGQFSQTMRMEESVAVVGVLSSSK